MKTITPTIITALLLVACDVPDASLTDSATDSGTETGTETSTDSGTSSDTSTDTSTETSTDTSTDTGTEDTGVTDAEWDVITADDQFVGRLATPEANTLPNLDDIFAGVDVVYLTDSGAGLVWGFNFNGFVGGIDIPHDVWFSEKGCTGIASTRFVTVKATDASPAQVDCNMDTINAMASDVIMHFGQQADAAAWVEWRWPGADGVVARRNGGDRWYGLPVDQEWPAWKFVQSRRLTDGTCQDFDSSGCMIELIDIGWSTAVKHEGPFHLEPAE